MINLGIGLATEVRLVFFMRNKNRSMSILDSNFELQNTETTTKKLMGS